MLSHQSFEIRRKVEEKIIPGFLYNQKSAVFAAVMDKEGRFFSDIYNCMFYDPTGETEYKSKDFSVEIKSFAHQDTCFYIMVVNMPQSDDIGVCRRVYLCYDRESELCMYFISQRTENGYRLCTVNENGKKIEYGSSKDDYMLELADIVREILAVLDSN